MIAPFHLSIAVSQLDEVKTFYVDILGCQVGRDRGSWVDVLFFGHQLTIHQATEHRPAVAIDHFGPVLDRTTWQSLVELCATHGIEYTLPPRVTETGSDLESGKFVISDPAGNLLEFKYYQDFSRQ